MRCSTKHLKVLHMQPLVVGITMFLFLPHHQIIISITISIDNNHPSQPRHPSEKLSSHLRFLGCANLLVNSYVTMHHLLIETHYLVHAATNPPRSRPHPFLPSSCYQIVLSTALLLHSFQFKTSCCAIFASGLRRKQDLSCSSRHEVISINSRFRATSRAVDPALFLILVSTLPSFNSLQTMSNLPLRQAQTRAVLPCTPLTLTSTSSYCNKMSIAPQRPE